ncbi:MAG: peptidylprolyl isomerase [Bacteroidales bacterium]|jgi:peptidyl-prolyl cis-trans isomerase SurA
MKFISKSNSILIILISVINIFALNFNKATAQEQVVIDEIVGLVGKHPVYWSDVETNKLQVQAYADKVSECDIFEKLLLQKLYIHYGEIDSVQITDDQVESELDRRLRYYIQQFGSQQKLEEFYDKSVIEFKNELREPLRLEILAQTIEGQITSSIKASPKDAQKFFYNLPADSIPLIPSLYEIAQIVKTPKIGIAEQQEARQKLEDIKERILKGEKFSTLAVLYSEDQGSATRGGELGFFTKGIMAPEFETASFGLKNKGDISDIIKTKFGYHLIQLIEKKKDEVNVRHILIMPKVNPEALIQAARELDSIAELVRNNEIPFKDAVLKFSDDPGKVNGGYIQSQYTGNTLLSAEELDPKMFFVVDKLNVGEISNSTQYYTEDGTSAFRLLYLVSRTEPHKASLDTDFNIIQQWALEGKREKAIAKWVQTNSKNAYIKIGDRYKNCKLKYNWNVNQ